MTLNIFEKIFYVIKNNTTIKTQQDLAMVLGITQPSISDAKKRNVFPFDWLVKICVIYGISLDSILSLGHKDSSINQMEAKELSELLDKSFSALKEYNKIIDQNISYEQQIADLNAKLEEVMKYIQANKTFNS